MSQIRTIKLAPVPLGFTLIELMIVITIMTIALTLVGPSLFKVYDKSKVRSDLLSLKDSTQKIAYKAFINDRAIELKASGNTISFFYQDEKLVINSLSYDYIAFPEQSIVFSNFGFADTQELKVMVDSQVQIFELKD